MAERKTSGQLINPSLAQRLDQRRRALHSSMSTTTPDDQTLDWVPISSQIAGAVAAPPVGARNVPEDSSHPVQAGVE